MQKMQKMQKQKKICFRVRWIWGVINVVIQVCKSLAVNEAPNRFHPVRFTTKPRTKMKQLCWCATCRGLKERNSQTCAKHIRRHGFCADALPPDALDAASSDSGAWSSVACLPFFAVWPEQKVTVCNLKIGKIMCASPCVGG